jgi:hypothetical protein
MKRIAIVLLLLVCGSIFLLSCVKKTRVPQATVPTANQATAWQADGVISPGEYPHQVVLDAITVYYRNDAQYLYLALQAQDCSFLAFAVAPKSTMTDANFLIGSVSKGTVKVEDQFGASYHSHTLDTLLGGTNDIVASGGTQQNGITTWEAQIPLDSGDKYDIPLKPGQTVSVIVSMRSSDNLTSPHTFHTSGVITLD